MFEDACAAKGAELFGQRKFVVMLEDNERVGREKIGSAEKFERASVVDAGGVRGIDEYEIEGRSGRGVTRSEFLQGGKRVGREDGVAGTDFERIEILAD